MAVPTYEELLARYNVNSSLMEQAVSDNHLMRLATSVDSCEMLATSMGIPDAQIRAIMSQGDVGMQRIRLLNCWKQRCGSMATYKALVEALLQIERTDLVENVLALLKPVTAPTPPPNNKQPAPEVISSLRKLEEEFHDLMIYIEDTLESNSVSPYTIIRRFRMLPQSVRRQHETDKCYKETRRRILDSETVKKLFDNLTELKHWNYMTPDTLAHILKDVHIDKIHKKLNEYKEKLAAFKANTKLRELIYAQFLVPDYCMELTMEVKGWEDKTIQEVEDRAVNIVRQATYSGSAHVDLGWKGVIPGSIKMEFILRPLISVKLNPEKMFRDKGIVTVQVDGDVYKVMIKHVHHYYHFYNLYDCVTGGCTKQTMA